MAATEKAALARFRKDKAALDADNVAAQAKADEIITAINALPVGGAMAYPLNEFITSKTEALLKAQQFEVRREGGGHVVSWGHLGEV